MRRRSGSFEGSACPDGRGGAALGGCRESERELAEPLFAQLGKGDLALIDIAECRLDRPRRPRVYDRVVKVKASKYAAKRAHHRQRTRDIEKDLCLVAAEST